MPRNQISQTPDAAAEDRVPTDTSYRYVIIAGSLLMQLCLGMTYSWSLFVKPLRQLLDISQAVAQFPLTLFYIAFPLTAVFAGTLLARRGPRLCAVLGGLVFGCGWMVASLGIHSFAWTVVGVGLLGGIGVGLAYLVPIATCIQWFPERKGLVTGIAVTGFGGGSALIASVGGYCMRTFDMGPCDLMRNLGICALVTVCLGGFLMRRPPHSKGHESSPISAKSVLRDPVFRLLYLGMIAGLAAGLGVTGNLKELGPVSAASSGAAAIALFAIGNGIGRLVWGIISDKFRVMSVIRLNLLLQAAVLLTAAAMTKVCGGLSAQMLVVLACAAGFNYGGILVLYASASAQRYGVEHVGRVYGWMFSSNAPASFAPVLAGLAFDRTGSFALPLIGIAALAVLAAGLMTRVGPDVAARQQ